MLNMGMQRDEDAATGLEYVTTLMIRCKMIEVDLCPLDPETQHNTSSEVVISLRTSIVELYSKVFEYQIGLIKHYDHGKFIRFFRDVFGITHWKDSQKDMVEIYEKIAKDEQSLCNGIVRKMDKALAKFDEENMERHAITQQEVKVRQLSLRRTCLDSWY